MQAAATEWQGDASQGGQDPSCPARWAVPGAGLPLAHTAGALLPAKPSASTPLSAVGNSLNRPLVTLQCPLTVQEVADVAASRAEAGGELAAFPSPAPPAALLGSVARDQKFPPTLLRVLIPITARVSSGE